MHSARTRKSKVVTIARVTSWTNGIVTITPNAGGGDIVVPAGAKVDGFLS